MNEEILTAAAIPSRPARFPDPPELHAVHFDSVDTDGPDLGPATSLQHNCTVELYAPTVEAGNEALQRLTAQLDARAIRYTTQGWYWLKEIRRYQEIIEFTHTQKI